MDNLMAYYSIENAEHIPSPRSRSLWTYGHKFGFMKGILEYANEEHRQKLVNLLQDGAFQDTEQAFHDEMFAQYIFPFHKNYGASRNTTPNGTPRAQSPATATGVREAGNSGSAESLINAQPRPVTPRSSTSSKTFRDGLLERDGVCLFCWLNRALDGAHIIAYKNAHGVRVNEQLLLQNAGLSNINDIQNGLLLCKPCHDLFDKLQAYIEPETMSIDVVDSQNINQDVVKLQITASRQVNLQVRSVPSDWIPMDEGMLKIRHLSTNQNLYPSKEALRMHKIACLIWKMAGGSEPNALEEDDDSDYQERATIIPENNLDKMTT